MREYVMAILCSPLSANELQTVERNNSVYIIRRLDYSEKVFGYLVSEKFFDNYDEFPFKLMFVFGNDDTIIVRSTVDKQEVRRKLNYTA